MTEGHLGVKAWLAESLVGGPSISVYVNFKASTLGLAAKDPRIMEAVIQDMADAVRRDVQAAFGENA